MPAMMIVDPVSAADVATLAPCSSLLLRCRVQAAMR